MEEDEELQSQPSPGTGSPASLRPNGRITVTVATGPPQKPLTLALPTQQPRVTGNGGGGGSGGGGREDCWSEGATAVLIDAWGERYLELSRGNLKQKHWKDVADIVSSRDDYTKTAKTDIQCKNRIDTVKKKYKAEKTKISDGGAPSKWPFFEKLDQLIGPTAKIPSAGGGAATGTGTSVAATSSLPPPGNQKVVPMGIPVGMRSHHQFQQQQPKQKQQSSRKRPQLVSDSSGSEPESVPSPDSSDSFPPATYERKQPPKIQRELNSSGVRRPAVIKGRDAGGAREKNHLGNSVRELTRAILKFGEAYEQAENSKLQQLVEMENQRMKYAKDMELQRTKFFIKAQMDFTELKHQRVVGKSNHHSSNNNVDNNNNNDNSDSSN